MKREILEAYPKDFLPLAKKARENAAINR